MSPPALIEPGLASPGLAVPVAGILEGPLFCPPYIWPNAALCTTRLSVIAVITAPTRYNFVFILVFLKVSRRLTIRRNRARANSKRLPELTRNAAGFLQFVETVFLLEYPKTVQLHPAKKRAVNRAHDLRRNHRTPILSG